MSCPHCVTTIAVIESSSRQDNEGMSVEDVVEMEMLGSFAKFIREKHNARAHLPESVVPEGARWTAHSDEQGPRA